MDKLFKVTKIEGGEATVTSPEFDLSTQSSVVFLIGASETPLTVKVVGYKDEDETDVKFQTRTLAETEWIAVSEEGLDLERTEEFLVFVSSDALAHYELESVSLVLDAGEEGTTPETIFAFEKPSRYKVE
jgi:ribosomal protein L11 methylase PrmA